MQQPERLRMQRQKPRSQVFPDACRPTPALLRAVDLRLLQLVREIYVHRLPLSVEIDGADPAFAVSVAGGLCATEGQVHLGAYGRSVDVRDSCVQVAHRGERLVHVFGVDRGRKPVLDAIRDLNRFIHAITWDDAYHWPEDFFLCNAHLGINIDEDRRFHEPAVLVIALLEAIAAAYPLGALVLADLDIAEVRLQLLLVDSWTHLHSFVEPIAHLEFFRALDQPLVEFAVDPLLHDDAAGRGAALSGGAEGAPERAFEGELEIGIVEDNHGILTAKFE